MLTWEFSAQDLARTRFARSPLGELVTSVEVLKDPGRHAVHLPWVRAARRRLAGVGWELLSALVRLPTVYVADFLTPVPDGPDPTIERQAAELAATDPAVVRRDLARIDGELHPLVARLARDPESGMARLAAEVEAYWAAAIAPHWARMQRLTDGEILRRARQMSAGGPAALFADLHPQVGWERDTLRIGHRIDVHRRLDGARGLVLLPTVFAWPGVYSQQNPPWQPGLVYPPRGVATLWETSGEPVPEGLARVLGRTRARLLAELDAPASTTELAARTGLSAPNLSHHLGALHDAGLLARHRTGRTVLYLRTEAAELLLNVR